MSYANATKHGGHIATFIMEKEKILVNGTEDGLPRAVRATYGKTKTSAALCGYNSKPTLVMEQTEPKILSYTRQMVNGKVEVVNRHTKDVANTIHASHFENTEQYVVEPKMIQNPHGFQKGGVQNNCPTITSSGFQDNNFLCETQGWRIRKLTPRECFRLQDVDDTDIDKIQAAGIPKTQQYKLAGNSLVTSVFYHLLRKLLIEKGNENRQLELF